MRKSTQYLQYLNIGLTLIFSATCPVHSLLGAPNKTATVYTQAAKATPLSDTLTYPARLVPKVNASVLSESDGVVSQIKTPLGAVVGKGQALLTIKHTDPLYDYAPFSVTAPVKGVVSGVEITEGSRVTRGQKLLSITDPSQISITLEIAAVDYSALKAGMLGELRIPGETLAKPVRVRGISPFIDPGTGTATAELELFPGSSKGVTNLPPGLVATVSFRTREHLGFEIPESALVYRGSQTFVRHVESGKAKYQSVERGPTRRGQIEITQGIKEGMEIIVRTSTYVADGDAVNIEKAASPETTGAASE